MPHSLRSRRVHCAAKRAREGGHSTLNRMKRNALWLLSIFFALTALWLLTDRAVFGPFTFAPMRSALVLYTGIIAFSAMSLGVLLSLRPARIEGAMSGLDKMYRAHKWLGVTALVAAATHWALVKSPGWLTTLGLLAPRVRGPRPAGGGPTGVEGALRALRGTAESLGEWAFYLVVVLLAVALVKRVPYRWFYWTHRLLAEVMLVFVFHGAVLMKFSYWSAPIGWVMAVLLIAAAVASALSLARRAGARRRFEAVVSAVVQHPASKITEVTVKLSRAWPGHAAGQFAFVSLGAESEAHPFTMTSAWTGDGTLSFQIKQLGDHTARLASAVKVGDRATVEGTYGRFTFEGDTSRQLWVAGGVGITPFLARLAALAKTPDARAIDLIFTTRERDEAWLEALREAAARAKVTLHVHFSERDGRLDVAKITATVPDWNRGDVWFSGPARFAKSLRASMIAQGLHPSAFHQELFEMR
jgi:predicted ferric reductase